MRPTSAVVGPAGGQVPPEVQRTIQRARGRGKALRPAVRQWVRIALQHEFGDVRLHTDPQADELAHLLCAKAFTVGEDIFFARGADGMDTRSGRALLVHELVHVMQQTSGCLNTGGEELVVRLHRQINGFACFAVLARTRNPALSGRASILRHSLA